MKQIKVYITPEQWAEKRLQLICHSYELTYYPERFDSLLQACGFELIESETKPEQPQPNQEEALNTRGNVFQELFNYLCDAHGVIPLEDDMYNIVNLCRPIIEHLDKPDEPILDKKTTKSNHPNALKYDELIQGEYYLKCKKTMFMEDGDRAATKGYYYPSVEMYNVFAGELSEAGCLDHELDDKSFLFEYFETYQHFPND